MTDSLKHILMVRDGMTSQEADDAITEAKERVVEGEDPEQILHDDFGLEPDYIFELLDL